MVLTIREVRRNSPSSGRPSTSSGIVCDRSPRATAPMTRAVSLVGSARSPISALTESIEAAQAPVTSPSEARCAELALRADHGAQALELARHALVELDDLVEGVGDPAVEAVEVIGQADREVTAPESLERRQQFLLVERLCPVAALRQGLGRAHARSAARRALDRVPALHVGLPWRAPRRRRHASHEQSPPLAGRPSSALDCHLKPRPLNGRPRVAALHSVFEAESIRRRQQLVLPRSTQNPGKFCKADARVYLYGSPGEIVCCWDRSEYDLQARW